MPYEWVSAPPAPDAPVAEAHLWPYRSLPKRGFVLFIGLTVSLVLIPLLSVIGTSVLWFVLPFITVTIGAVWWALGRSYDDGALIEELRFWPDRVTLSRHGPRDRHASWEANPHWVRVCLYPTGGPVENYVTLKGAGREVEIGSFLSEEERVALHRDLQERLAGFHPD